MSKFGYSFNPIVPEPDWGNPSPTIDPDEWVDDDELEDDD